MCGFAVLQPKEQKAKSELVSEWEAKGRAEEALTLVSRQLQRKRWDWRKTPPTRNALERHNARTYGCTAICSGVTFFCSISTV
jgi:hypothetical protein